MPDEIITQQTPTTEQPASPAAPAEKTFTQAEVEAIVGKRLAKAAKGLPDEAELTAFRAWKESRQTDEEKRAELTRERDTANARAAELEAKIEQMNRQIYLSSKGLQGDMAEFIAFKASKLVSDKVTFEAAVDSLIAEQHPQKAAFSWTAPLEGGAKPETVNSTMNALIRQARR